MNPSEKHQSTWEDFQNGDEAAYEQIYSGHIKAMYRYGKSLVPASDAFVLDCIHDVFTEIWIKKERLTVPDNIRYYLLRSLKTRILHLLTRGEYDHQSIEDGDFNDLWAEPSVEERFTMDEESLTNEKLMQKLIARLTHRQQEALRLRFTENLAYHEIGEMMQVNSQSAQNLVFRAIERLRSWMIF